MTRKVVRKLEITFEENAVSHAAQILLEIAREVSPVFKAVLKRDESGLVTVVLADRIANPEIFSIPVEPRESFRERALRYGIPGLPKQYQSGELSNETLYAIPRPEFIPELEGRYDTVCGPEYRLTHASYFVTPDWIISDYLRGAQDAVETMNAIAREYDNFIRLYHVRPTSVTSVPGNGVYDTCLLLGAERRAWLARKGPIDEVIAHMIDRAMAGEGWA